jgi:hypothetical protein
MHLFAIKGYKIHAETNLTIHLVLDTNIFLFLHLKNETVFLEQQLAGSNLVLIWAIEAAYTKLSKYYTKTSGKQGDFYNVGNILNSSSKTGTSENDNWNPENA